MISAAIEAGETTESLNHGRIGRTTSRTFIVANGVLLDTTSAEAPRTDFYGGPGMFQGMSAKARIFAGAVD